MVNVFADFVPTASVAVTVRTVDVKPPESDPLTDPFAVLNVSPGGNVPPDNAKVIAPLPPDAVTGVKGIPTVQPLSELHPTSGIATVVTTGIGAGVTMIGV